MKSLFAGMKLKAKRPEDHDFGGDAEVHHQWHGTDGYKDKWSVIIEGNFQQWMTPEEIEREFYEKESKS